MPQSIVNLLLALLSASTSAFAATSPPTAKLPPCGDGVSAKDVACVAKADAKTSPVTPELPLPLPPDSAGAAPAASAGKGDSSPPLAEPSSESQQVVEELLPPPNALTNSLSDVPDDPSIAPKLDEAARELEELRAVEATAVDPSARRAEEVFRAMRRAGPSSPLHRRLSDVLGPWPVEVVPDEAEMEAAALAEIGAFDIEKAKRLYDIPIEMTPLVAEFIRFFQVAARPHFVKWLGRSSRYVPMMRKALREAGLPEDTVYLSMIESGFSPMAYSWAHASGLWQFIEPTGKRFGLVVDFWEDQRRDPIKSTIAATRYLKELYSEFGDWRLAWAGYNAGEGTIRRALQIERTSDFWKIIEGRTLRGETKHYVPKLMAAALISKNPKGFGFSDAEIAAEAPLEYEEVETPPATDLSIIAQAAGVSVEQIKDLNPDLRRWCTPPLRKTGRISFIRLPMGAKARYLEEFPKIAPRGQLTFVVHRVARNDTLSRVASRYGSIPEAIMRTNGLRDSRRLKLNSELVIPLLRNGSHEELALAARKDGYVAAPVSQEVPVAPPRRGGRAAAGTIRTTKEGKRTKTVYGVAQGDSLWTISRQFGVTIADLREWNGLESERAKLRVGQEIVLYTGEGTAQAPLAKKAVSVDKQDAKVVAYSSVPSHSAVASASVPGKSNASTSLVSGTKNIHTVESGDTLWSVARRYKVSVEDLRRWNNLKKNKALQVGKPLTIVAP